MTKGELIKLLQEDVMPLDTPVEIYLECTNNDCAILSTSIDDIRYDKSFKALHINGTYDEDGY